MVELTVLALIALLVLGIILEGKREPERKVEMLQKQDDHEALLIELQQRDEKGDGTPG